MRLLLAVLGLLLLPAVTNAQSFDWQLSGNVVREYVGFFGGPWTFGPTYSSATGCIPWAYLAENETGTAASICNTASRTRFRMWPFDIRIKSLSASAGAALTTTQGCSLQLRTTNGTVDIGGQLHMPATNTTTAVGDIFSVRMDVEVKAGTPVYLLGKDGEFCASGTGCVCNATFKYTPMFLEYIPGLVQ